MQLISENLVDDILESMESRVNKVLSGYNNINTICCWNSNKAIVACYDGYDDTFEMNFYLVKLFTKSEEKIIRLSENEKYLIEKTARLIIEEKI